MHGLATLDYREIVYFKENILFLFRSGNNCNKWGKQLKLSGLPLRLGVEGMVGKPERSGEGRAELLLPNAISPPAPWLSPGYSQRRQAGSRERRGQTSGSRGRRGRTGGRRFQRRWREPGGDASSVVYRGRQVGCACYVRSTVRVCGEEGSCGGGETSFGTAGSAGRRSRAPGIRLAHKR